MADTALPGVSHAASAHRRGWLVLVGLVLLALALALVARDERHADLVTYPAPSLEGYVLNGSYQGDGDADGINETHIRRYRDLDGNRIFSMTTQAHLWAWSLDGGNDDDSTIADNYVIRDSNCDGSFDERYALGEPFHVPDCLQ